MLNYHHTVTENTTPNGEFTKWCLENQNVVMSGNPSAPIRRSNLNRYVKTFLGGNQSELMRRCSAISQRTSYFNDLLKSEKKSFGEKAARRIEGALGLLAGQLDILNSPLEHDPNRAKSSKEQLHDIIKDLRPNEERELVVAALDIVRRRKPKQRKSA